MEMNNIKSEISYLRLRTEGRFLSDRARYTLLSSSGSTESRLHRKMHIHTDIQL